MFQINDDLDLFKKLSKSRLSDPFLGLFLVIFEVLYSENSDFQDFSVLGENYAFYHTTALNLGYDFVQLVHFFGTPCSS